MAMKRTATTELNHENWGDEDEPETAGVFVRASADELKKRQIKTARRRGVVPASSDSPNNPEEQAASGSVFAGFSGFKKTEPTSTKAVFSFLAATPNGSGNKSDTASSSVNIGSSSCMVDENDKSGQEVNGVDSASDTKLNDKEYFRKLKGLNESVAKWINVHVASNPLVLLTPVFRDYERHLANIQGKVQEEDNKQYDSTKGSTNTSNDQKKDPTMKEEGDEISSTDVSDKIQKGKEEKQIVSGSTFGLSSSNASATATFSFGSGGSSQGTSSFCFGTSNSASSSGNTPTFSFGAASTSSPSAGFSFGNSKPFTFSNVASISNANSKKEDEDDAEDDTPPKPDHKPVNEDGATYSKRCKIYIKQGKQYSDRGIGNLFLKPIDGGKTQLIVRADTSLGNVLLNFLLGASLPVQRLGNNNVAVVCIPTPEAQPPPVTVLLRVKTSDDADELFSTLEKHKKEAA